MYYSFNIISLILTLIFIENVNGFLWNFLFPFHQPSSDTYDTSEDSNENYNQNRRYYIFKPKFSHRYPYWDSESDEDNSEQYIITHHRPKENYDSYYDDDENDSSGSSHHLSAFIQRRHKDDYLHKRHRKCRGKSSLQKLLALLFGSLQKAEHLPEAEKPGKKNDMYIHVELLKNKPKRKRSPRNKRKPRRNSFKNQNDIGSEENENLRIKRSAVRKIDVSNDNSKVPDTRNNLQSLASLVQNGKTTTKRPKLPGKPKPKSKSKKRKNGKKNGKKNSSKKNKKNQKKNQKKKSNKKKSNTSKFVRSFPSFFHNPYAPYL